MAFGIPLSIKLAETRVRMAIDVKRNGIRRGQCPFHNIRHLLDTCMVRAFTCNTCKRHLWFRLPLGGFLQSYSLTDFVSLHTFLDDTRRFLLLGHDTHPSFLSASRTFVHSLTSQRTCSSRPWISPARVQVRNVASSSGSHIGIGMHASHPADETFL